MRKCKIDLWSLIVSDATINESIRRTKRSKRMRRYLKRHHICDSVLQEYCRKLLYNYMPKLKKPSYRWDPISQKTRVVLVPDLDDLLAGHCLCIVLEPIVYKGLYEHRYSSIRGRGALQAKKVIEKYIRNNPGGVKYCFKGDIYHFFASISRPMLYSKCVKYIRDSKILDLILRVISVRSTEDIQAVYGLPLGFPTSPLFSAWLLQPLDHYIKEELHAEFYIGWADDMVIFGSNKKKLHEIKDKVEEFLREKLGLKLKGNWQIFRFSDVKIVDGKPKDFYRDLDFMGYRFYRNRTVLRKAVMLRATRKAAKIGKKQWPTVYDARQMMSYNGYFKYTCTRGCFDKYVKPNVKMSRLKNKISRKDRTSDGNIYKHLAAIYA